ncbi:4Fe-4S ferredoxin iron-sulfur binding domain-containing protein [Flexistipes sinusarabici DSM 4947]|uniref:4Fe-4S ferredoxin iron-sulfur binding domain-containing protein n=1 Tax=Flexistipes sinusarabici (strain ATCC 49648 / DSM 4947 / MAS 10) TaxID=717231 RepID=F8E5F6_FLESM|nr:DUF362 domain-containing protein [Flexistipes sinusarabici]AEI15719.1 4Fe-4S ferredoxin iron-sulfur binding domain-containing protein [Flexistipes sinusarabici DSM 4947]
MSSTVYHISPHSKSFTYENGLQGKFEQFLRDFEIDKYIVKDETVPLKIHLGGKGAFRTIRPQFVRQVVRAVKSIPAKPFVTDSVRIPAYDYLEVAKEAGYNHLTLDAPVVIADGMYGKESLKSRAGELIGDVYIASALHEAKSMVVLTHVKGHIQAVLGGAIKNISMGGVSNESHHGDWHEGRGKMHFLMGDIMEWDQEKCILCYDCMKVCPAECITFPNNIYTVDKDKCWRCGRCARVCPEDAIHVPVTHEKFMKAVAEGANAVTSTFEPKRIIYINFLTEMQPECDCMPIAENPVAQDQGILISDDPVAIDTATLDILSEVESLPGSRAEGIKKKHGWDIFSLLHQKDGRLQVMEAEKIGLGSMNYTIEKVD